MLGVEVLRYRGGGRSGRRAVIGAWSSGPQVGCECRACKPDVCWVLLGCRRGRTVEWRSVSCRGEVSQGCGKRKPSTQPSHPPSYPQARTPTHAPLPPPTAEAVRSRLLRLRGRQRQQGMQGLEPSAVKGKWRGTPAFIFISPFPCKPHPSNISHTTTTFSPSPSRLNVPSARYPMHLPKRKFEQINPSNNMIVAGASKNPSSPVQSSPAATLCVVLCGAHACGGAHASSALGAGGRVRGGAAPPATSGIRGLHDVKEALHERAQWGVLRALCEWDQRVERVESKCV